MTAALDVAGLTVDIATRAGELHAVRGVDLRIERGEMLCLVGESGCGKSLTALALMGLLPAGAERRATHLQLLGEELGDAGQARLRGDRVAMIFQDPMTSLNPTWAIGTQMVEGLRYHRPSVSHAAAMQRAAALLDTCGIREPALRLRQYPHQLSGGMRQRVMIAMALMTEPALLIADEPTTALDVTIQAQILELLARLQRDFSLAILLITHDLAVVGHHADRVAVMYAGEIVETAAAELLFEQPMHPYTRALIACKLATSGAAHTRLGFVPGTVPSLIGTLSGCLFRERCAFARDTCAADVPMQTPAPGRSYRCVIPPLALPDLAPVDAMQSLGAAPPEGDNVALELTGVGVDFEASSGLFAARRRIAALHDVSMVVHRGTIFGVAGESGSGKSTLARVMLGLQRPTRGRIELLGRSFASYDRRSLARAVQPVFQDPYSSLNPRRAIGAAIRLPLDVHGIGAPQERLAAVRRMMDLCGLAARLADSYPSQLSGGQRQRVALASALVMRPEIVICDEPTSALDVSIQAQILNLLLDLRTELNLTYVLISHDLDVIRHMADRIAIMHQGEIVEQGDAESIFAAPAHEYTKALLQTRPRRTGERHEQVAQ